MTEQLAALQKQIDALKTKSSRVSVADRVITAVAGGLASLKSKVEAEKWLKEKLWHLYGPQPTEVYVKGDFKGIAFAKFPTTGERDRAVSVLKAAGAHEGGDPVWAKPDLPLEVRVLKRFLFEAKHVLTSIWGYPNTSVYADPDTGILYVGNDIALTLGCPIQSWRSSMAKIGKSTFHPRTGPRSRNLPMRPMAT